MKGRTAKTTRLRRIIAQGGGLFVGIQEGTPSVPSQALFLDKRTGTTLALPVERITADAVRALIRKSRRTFLDSRRRET